MSLKSLQKKDTLTAVKLQIKPINLGLRLIEIFVFSKMMVT